MHSPYNLSLVTNETIEKSARKILKKFIKNSVDSYSGVDFEFNKVSREYKDVALMQISLSHDGDTVSDVIVLDPKTINKKTLKTLHKLLCSKRITKILHGTESLDISYIYKQLLISKEQISKFANSFYDTKMICDFMKVINNPDQKDANCSIYEMLLNNKVISKELYDELNRIDSEKSLEEYIDIQKLPPILLDYAIRDVLYLPQLIKAYLKYEKYLNMYLLIREIYGIITISKHALDMPGEFIGSPEIYPKLTVYINKFNLKKTDDNKKFISLFNYYTNNIYNQTIKILYDINYFRKFIKTILKLIIYLVYSKDMILQGFFDGLNQNYILLSKCVLKPYYSCLLYTSPSPRDV
jgi:hypothetical protein